MVQTATVAPGMRRLWQQVAGGCGHWSTAVMEVEELTTSLAWSWGVTVVAGMRSVRPARSCREACLVSATAAAEMANGDVR